MAEESPFRWLSLWSSNEAALQSDPSDAWRSMTVDEVAGGSLQNEKQKPPQKEAEGFYD